MPGWLSASCSASSEMRIGPAAVSVSSVVIRVVLTPVGAWRRTQNVKRSSASATAADVETLPDPLLQARARHVVSENARVRSFAAALAAGDLPAAGALMVESHRSLAGDFEVSTGRLDEMVAGLTSRPGVYGARLTGAGFGGCVVALTRPGALREGWVGRASGGAWVG